jgi:hypothetical protein
MALSLKGLATEIQLAIADVLVATSGDHHAICEWSSTCSFYRTLLTAYVFETISLRNDEESTTNVLRIARGPYSEHVKNLVYTGLSSDFVSDGYEFRHSQTIHNVFPPLVGEVLSELQQFPCLNSLDIKFSVHEDEWSDCIMDHGWEELHLPMADCSGSQHARGWTFIDESDLQSFVTKGKPSNHSTGT